jgi:deoxyadenosine/deoxycytidine kinase
MTPPILLSIEGNIGSGKSTLLKTIPDYDWLVKIQEPVDLWSQIVDLSDGETILTKFYKDPAKYAFAFQILAYSTRLSIIRNVIKENPSAKVILSERSLDTDRFIFAKMLYDDGKIDDVSYQIYKNLFDTNPLEIPLGGVLYLDVDAETCNSRIKKRAREGEDAIPLDYLRACEKYHRDWLYSDMPYPVKTIDESFMTNPEEILLGFM